MTDFNELGDKIIELIGGSDNVIGLRHCVTRLRFNLKEIEKAQTEKIKKLDGVANVLISAGQYQIVIGNEVIEAYQAIEDRYNFSGNRETEQTEISKMTLFEAFVDILSNVFTPLIGLLSATGIIKGISILFVAVGLLKVDSGTFIILQIIGDSLMMFSPIFVGYTAAKRFGLNEFLGMAIGATLIHTQIATLMTGEPLLTIFSGSTFETSVYTSFLSIPVLLMSYSGSVIPIIFATYVGAKIEKLAKTIIPKVVRLFLVPSMVLLLTVPLTFIIIGPVATWLGQGIAFLTMQLYQFSSILTGALAGAFWQIFVLLGLHHALMPISLNNIEVIGFDSVIASRLVSIFAVFGVTLAVIRKASKIKQEKIKAIAIPASISAFFGVTEPAIYGVLVSYKNAFLCSIIGGAIGGGISGFFDSKLYTQGGLGILAFPSYINSDGSGIDSGFLGIVIGSLIACVVGYILFTMFGVLETNEGKVEISKTNEKNQVTDVFSPIKGRVFPLTDVEDEVFSTKVMGDGVAIIPSEGAVRAPFNGVITTLFPTLHAIGITGENGVELLIHIGFDTVNLEGKYFKSCVNQGDSVKTDELLVEFDIEGIKKENYSIMTPIIVMNTKSYKDISVTNAEKVNFSDTLLILNNKEEL